MERTQTNGGIKSSLANCYVNADLKQQCFRIWLCPSHKGKTEPVSKTLVFNSHLHG
jgi:hypothetical protein